MRSKFRLDGLTVEDTVQIVRRADERSKLPYCIRPGANSDECDCPNDTYHNLPVEVQELRCVCLGNRTHTSLRKLGVPLSLVVCERCGKPNPYSVSLLAFVCSECYEWFTLDWRKFMKKPRVPYVEPTKCEDCNVSVSTVGPRRRGFNIN